MVEACKHQDFESFIKEMELVPAKRIPYFVMWVTRYIRFCLFLGGRPATAVSNKQMGVLSPLDKL